ncbi:hypothetical protein PVK06_044787 [Gossypium arboreum]|uniref:Protein BIG GRAIN 1-like E n=2 Tax=Gossypium arboreum TaxID=29729 RepID=A0ABR0MU61_GOSAR|nr:hypothetical protein PVK06_044787 [Gossypium arboreum]
MVHNKRKQPNIKHESIQRSFETLARGDETTNAVDFIVPDYISSSFLISCYSMAPITFQILKQIGGHNIISIKVSSFNPDTMLKKSFHHRNGSGELDVFEAARYFSGYNEAASYNCGTLISQKVTRDENQPLRGDRISLDVAMRRNPLLDLHQSHLVEKHVKEKKHKQPSSPGGKLATFLNSLFNQTGSKKKKNSKSTTQSMKDEEVSPGGRRKRRISISHFRSSNTVDTKSFYSSSSSGFRTPPPYASTPTKRNETSKLIDGFLEKYKNIEPHHQDKNMSIRVDRYQSEEKDFSKLCEVDDGADSDSSSDLFELQSYSSGLPVFETTNMDSFKRGAPVSNGAL